MNAYDHIDISEVLSMAAACVRDCDAARQLGGTPKNSVHADDDDEGICVGTVVTAIENHNTNICFIGDCEDDVMSDDLVVIDVAEQHAIIGVVSADGQCLRPDIVSHEQVHSYLSHIQPDILLPLLSSRLFVDVGGGQDAMKILVIAGDSAQRVAMAAGGLGIRQREARQILKTYTVLKRASSPGTAPIGP